MASFDCTSVLVPLFREKPDIGGNETGFTPGSHPDVDGHFPSGIGFIALENKFVGSSHSLCLR